jgi:hypothetical protein
MFMQRRIEPSWQVRKVGVFRFLVCCRRSLVSPEGLLAVYESSLETLNICIFHVVEFLSHRCCQPYETNHLNKNTIFFQTYNKGDKFVSTNIFSSLKDETLS